MNNPNEGSTYNFEADILKLKRTLIQIRNFYSPNHRPGSPMFNCYNLPLKYDDSFIQNMTACQRDVFSTDTLFTIRHVGKPASLITLDKILIQCIWNIGELTWCNKFPLNQDVFYLNFNIIKQYSKISDDETYHIFNAWKKYLDSIQASARYKSLNINENYLESLQTKLSDYPNKRTLPHPNDIFKEIYLKTNTENNRQDLMFLTIELILTVALILSAVASGGGSTLSIGLMVCLYASLHSHVFLGLNRLSVFKVQKEHDELLYAKLNTIGLKGAGRLVDEINQDYTNSNVTSSSLCASLRFY